MRRILIVGAGFFGRVIERRLADEGIASVVASRNTDVRLDVEDRRSIARVLRPDDVIIDTAGPFQTRSTWLLEGAIERVCDVVDLSDSLGYAERVLALADRAAAADVRVLTSCSAIAAVAAAAIGSRGGDAPESCDLFLAPASSETSNPATVRAFLGSVGAPIRTFRDGRLSRARGWSESRPFPGDHRRGNLVESAAAVLLPVRWPSLRRVEFWVDPNAPLASSALALAARVGMSRALSALAPIVAPVGRAFGRRDGVFAVAIRAGGREASVALSAPRGSYVIAAEPAVMAAAALARGERMRPGIVPVDAQLGADELWHRLRGLGVDVRT